ncbi:MAG: type II toxin-antitoxin system prevent-host-death family antitoxin [Dethiobacter sp.]|nr:type II toxin-antitoxin system prevent-host-death family antitoxin [Dethiobacter sp.]
MHLARLTEVHYTVHMRTINYTTARRNLASAMDAVIEDHTPVIITKGSDKAVVMMSLDDWNAWQETMHLLRNPANAERLLKATRDFAEGKNLVIKESLLE